MCVVRACMCVNDSVCGACVTVCVTVSDRVSVGVCVVRASIISTWNINKQKLTIFRRTTMAHLFYFPANIIKLFFKKTNCNVLTWLQHAFVVFVNENISGVSRDITVLVFLPLIQLLNTCWPVILRFWDS